MNAMEKKNDNDRVWISDGSFGECGSAGALSVNEMSFEIEKHRVKSEWIGDNDDNSSVGCGGSGLGKTTCNYILSSNYRKQSQCITDAILWYCMVDG